MEKEEWQLQSVCMERKKKKESSAIKEDSKISSLKSLKITSLKKKSKFHHHENYIIKKIKLLSLLK